MGGTGRGMLGEQGPHSVPKAPDVPSPSRGALLVAVSSGKADSQGRELPATMVTSHVPSRLPRSHTCQRPARCTLSWDTSPAGPSLTGALGAGGWGSVHGGGTWWGQSPTAGAVTCGHPAAGHSGGLKVWPADQQRPCSGAIRNGGSRALLTGQLRTYDAREWLLLITHHKVPGKGLLSAGGRTESA